jgi:hypothetical protein
MLPPAKTSVATAVAGGQRVPTLRKEKRRQDARCGVGRPAKPPVGIPGQRRLVGRVLSVLDDRDRRGIPGRRLLARRVLSVQTRQRFNAKVGGWFRTNLQVSPDCQNSDELNQRCAAFATVLRQRRGSRRPRWHRAEASQAFALAAFCRRREPRDPHQVGDRRASEFASSCAFNFRSRFLLAVVAYPIQEAVPSEQAGSSRTLPKTSASAWKGSR